MTAYTETGSPIKGLVKRKNTSPVEKMPPFFPLTPTPATSTMSFLPTRSRSAPVSSVSLVLGQPCLRPRADADPHQSPIRIKAFVLYAQCLKHGPCPPRLFGPRKSSVPCRVQLDVLQILWFLANPFVAHDIGESVRKNDYRPRQCLLYGCSRYQSGLVDSIPTPMPAHCCT